MNSLIPVADGIEEMETVIIIDILRRAGGKVVVAGLGDTRITASRGVQIIADRPWLEADPSCFDALVIPGGAGGVRLLAAEPTVLDAVRSFADTGRLLAAICAAPLILHAAGVIEGRRIACHPSIEASLSGAIVVREPVVVDGHIVTSRGAGTAIEFALRILDLTGQESAATGIASAILHERYPHC